MSNVFRILRGSFVIFLIALLALCVGALWFIAYKGRPLLLNELRVMTERDVSIGSISIAFSGGLLLERIEIKGLASVAKAVVLVDVNEGLHGRLVFSSADVFSPKVNIDLTPPKELKVEAVQADDKTVPSGRLFTRRKARVLPRLNIHDGTLMFQAPEAGRTWVVDKINAQLSDVPLGDLSQQTSFHVSASLQQMNVPFVGHLVKMNGWLNWQARDMEAVLSVIDDDGRVGVDATLVSKNNDLSVSGKARLAIGQQKQASTVKTRMVEDVVLGLLDATGTEVDSEFSFTTQMDNPKVGPIKLTGTITTGLNSSAVSGNIVGALKALGAEVLGPEAKSLDASY
jgi:hypothetical protein